MNTTTQPISCQAPSGPPEFLRLPKPGQLCQFTGLTRSALNNLVLPNRLNGGHPTVKSYVLRQRGAVKGIRLIDYASLRSYILSNEQH